MPKIPSGEISRLAAERERLRQQAEASGQRAPFFERFRRNISQLSDFELRRRHTKLLVANSVRGKGRTLRRAAATGAVAGALIFSQGPKMADQYRATESSMRNGAQTALNAEHGTSLYNRALNMIQKKPTPRVPTAHVGETVFSRKGPNGDVYVGRATVTANTVRTFKPGLNFTGGTAKAAGKGAVAGGVGGVVWGAAFIFRSRRKRAAAAAALEAEMQRRGMSYTPFQ